MDSFHENYPSTFRLDSKLLGSEMYTIKSRDVMPNFPATEKLEGSKQERTIHVYLLQHEKTKLFVAISAELRGLVVHGRSPDEIEGKLSAAVQDILEAEGHQVVAVQIERDDRIVESGFGPPPYIANASLAAAQR